MLDLKYSRAQHETSLVYLANDAALLPGVSAVRTDNCLSTSLFLFTAFFISICHFGFTLLPGALLFSFSFHRTSQVLHTPQVVHTVQKHWQVNLAVHVKHYVQRWQISIFLFTLLFLHRIVVSAIDLVCRRST